MTGDANPDLDHASRRTFGRALAALNEGETRVLKLVKGRNFAARHPESLEGSDRFGERLADSVAEFGGSWTFIMLFGAFLVVWTGANVWLLTRPPDPYPFIFLNLLLSMVAALQAPIIMMSQNRQAAKDRRNAAADYECNLKAEIEIMALHDKLDEMRNEHLATLVASQQEQIALLKRLLEQRGAET
jgi:uncharacterized membrane protein